MYLLVVSTFEGRIFEQWGPFITEDQTIEKYKEKNKEWCDNFGRRDVEWTILGPFVGRRLYGAD